MSSYKQLSKADVTTVNYHANKRWNFTYTGSINDNYIISYVGKNEPFNITGLQTTNNQYQSLIYAEINHLFYQAYSGSLNTGSIMMNPDTYTSASQFRPINSYFNYNSNPLLIKQFPTGSGEAISVLSVNQDVYGSKILPYSFVLSSLDVLIKDDGNGNLYNIAGAQNQYIDLNYITTTYFSSGSILPIGVEFIGNIFYAHGIVVLTNQSSSYQNIFTRDCQTLTLQSPGGTATYSYTNCEGTYTSSIVNSTTIIVCADFNQSVSVVGGGIWLWGGPCGEKSISFQNEHIIYENEVRCIVRESDYNLTYNPTLLQYGGEYIALSGSLTPSGSLYTLTGSFDSTVKDFATGSAFQPYVTTIGLYNDMNELLMVAKLSKPIMLSPDTDTTFIVRYDT